MTRAQYIIVSQDETTVLIRDIGTTCMSVTNDAEAVVRDLHELHALSARQLLYFDSENEVDELKHDGHGNFTGFAPVADEFLRDLKRVMDTLEDK